MDPFADALSPHFEKFARTLLQVCDPTALPAAHTVMLPIHRARRRAFCCVCAVIALLALAGVARSQHAVGSTVISPGRVYSDAVAYKSYRFFEVNIPRQAYAAS